MGTIKGKVWGTTERVFSGNNVIIERIFARKGWKCSDHLHKGRHNLFYIESGKVLIRSENDGLMDEVVLGPLQSTSVNPDTRHQFEAIEDSWVLEVYWITIDGQDIVRFSQGGKADERTGAGTIEAEVPCPYTQVAH